MNLTIHTEIISENQKKWISKLLLEAADKSEEAARNEHLWSMGTTNTEIAEMHRQNEYECLQYAGTLRVIVEKING